MPILQQTRFIAIQTALGSDVLAVRSVSVQEQLGRLFQIDAELSSENGEINFDQVIGHPVSLRIELGRNGSRYFHGYISRLVQGANSGGFAHYRATIVPWLWLLTRTSDCRIFQKKKIPDIIEDVFQRRGFSDYELSLNMGAYDEKEFCVQYRETDFNFVSRLMEQEGIYYYFRQEEDKAVLVLADSISAHVPFPDYEEISFSELERGATGREVVTDWVVEKEVQPVAYALTDFNFETPSVNLLAPASVTREHGAAEYEIFDFPGEYLKVSEGERLARLRIEELQAQYETLRGRASARGIATGLTFTLKNHPREDQNREYLITGVSIQVDSGEFASTDGRNGGDFFTCSFTAIDSTQPFRPARTTPKPIVQGPQTAIVVGPSGEEIHTDSHARVKVHFHWDRHGEPNENASCFIRVSQPWAGKGWGSMATPRIGQEVIVEFLEGDPDRPIITGRVYNNEQKAPYAGGNGVVSGLKSQTHKGAGSNEISLDDTAGKEKMTIHGQYDQSTDVGHDQSNSIGNNRTTSVAVDDTESIGSNQKTTVGANQNLDVGANQSSTVGANQSLTVGANQTEQVGSSKSESIGVAKALSIGAAYQVSVGAAMNESIGAAKAEQIGGAKIVAVGGISSETVGASKSVKSGGKMSHTAGGKMAMSAGGDLDASTKAKAIISAASELTLKCGGASLVLKSGGEIIIKGTDVSVNGSEIKIKASGEVGISGSTIKEN